MEKPPLRYSPFRSQFPAQRQALPPVERRLHRRYPINLEVEYKLYSEDRALPRRSGTTLNISSGGVLFQVDSSDPLAVDASIELLVRWPFRLDGIRPLNLAVLGSVVRRDAKGVAVKITRYEFRTASERMLAKTALI